MKPIDISENPETTLRKHFDGLHSGGPRSHIRGGQTAADAALATLDITGYAAKRSEVLPRERRGATVLSPYIRHNLLTLSQVWHHVHDAPARDREKFRDELLWQEYARHLYARLGTRLFENLRFQQRHTGGSDSSPGVRNHEPNWEGELACISAVNSELHEDGWLVNQTRMWLASHHTVRNGFGWLDGQELMYRELIDGSRAANLLGWQWTVGSATGKPYSFSRWQVNKRAPGLCETCPLSAACPIEHFAPEQTLTPVAPEPLLFNDPDLMKTTGPTAPVSHDTPEFVLLTVDSMGDADPALAAHPDLPAVFVFNHRALSKLQLSAKRLYFYLETLQDLASRRELSVYLGDPAEFAAAHRVALTFAPVPSFAQFTNVAELHPFPWLVAPHEHAVGSYSAWRKKITHP